MPKETDIPAWIAATTKLTKVNDILRTSWMCSESGEWVGVVLRSPELRVVSKAYNTEDESKAFLESFVAEPFTFGEPFIKYATLAYPDGSYDIAIKMDHAVYDGTLFRLFDDHFAAILTEAPIPQHTPFKDYAFHMYNSDKSGALTYWKDTLQNLPLPYLSSVNSPSTTGVHRTMMTTNIDGLVESCSVTPSSIFQAAYQLWLAKTTGKLDVSFDYLLSGRNTPFSADPMTINGTLANFLPLRSPSGEDNVALGNYLEATQDAFWAATENGDVGLADIYGHIGVDRETYGNRTLFLFQPFEPTGGDDSLRWLVMAKSRVNMIQPYALVVEVAKGKERGQHKLAIYYDDKVFQKSDVEGIANEINLFVERMANSRADTDVKTILEY